MNVFVSLSRYIPRVGYRLVRFLFFSVISSLFGAFNIILIIPMLTILFDRTENQLVQLPEFTFSSGYLIAAIKYFFHAMIEQYGKFNALLFVCVALVVILFITNAFRFMEHVIITRMRVDLMKNLRLHFFDHLSKLHIGFFHKQKKGDLISRFIGTIESIDLRSLKSALKDPITIVVYLFVLFSISVKLTFLIIILFPLIGGVIAKIIRSLKKNVSKNQDSMERIAHIFDETFGGMRIIKAFNARRFVVEKMTQELGNYRTTQKSMLYRQGLAAPASEFLGVMIVVVIIFFGGTLVLQDNAELAPDFFLGFLALFAVLIQPVKNLANSVTDLQRVKTLIERIFSFFTIEPAIKNKPNAIEFKEFNRDIEFINVSFSYDSTLVLKNINLRIQKGTSVALVGSSGVGKSTLVDLIPRFYDPTEGQINIDGKSLINYNISSVRQHIGVVSQESILFNDTIFNNIAFGMRDVSMDQIVHAASIANADEFINQMPKGYHTHIGERGIMLSGGQRQRISIARAVLRNPSILILDEATNALDAESEKLVQKALSNLTENRTSIIITHRLSTIQHADNIIVFKEGKVIETGTHEELVRASGEYQKFISMQQIN